jgi:hypothetical protein
MPFAAACGKQYKRVVQRLAANKGEREEEKRREISAASCKAKHAKLHNTKKRFMRRPVSRTPTFAVPRQPSLRGVEVFVTAVRFGSCSLSSAKFRTV